MGFYLRCRFSHNPLKNPILLNENWVFKSGICRKIWPKSNLYESTSFTSKLKCYYFKMLQKRESYEILLKNENFVRIQNLSID